MEGTRILDMSDRWGLELRQVTIYRANLAVWCCFLLVCTITRSWSVVAGALEA